MIQSKHIDVRIVADGVDVIVDDHEVFDYIDDFLTDLGFSFAFTEEEKRDDRTWHLMHFEVEATPILKAINSISSAEIDRIWALNNSAG